MHVDRKEERDASGADPVAIVTYHPETDDVRIKYGAWTEDTYAVQSPASIIMVDKDVVVGIVFPNFLRMRLDEVPESYEVREQLALLMLEEDEYWAI